MSMDTKRCDDLWFVDGTVVLQAEKTLFRVYFGILIKYSSFFESLFTLPQPPDAETYDGCPLVILQGDTAEDVYDFLRAMFDTSFSQSFPRDVHRILAILKLSNKYDAQGIRQRVIEGLSPFIPTTFSDFDSWTLGSDNPLDLGNHSPFVATDDILGLAAIAEHSAPIFVPFALYGLQCIDPASLSNVLDGVPARRGRFILSPRLQRAYLQGRLKLTALSRKEVYPSLFSRSQCRTSLSCDSLRLALIQSLQETDGYLDPLWPYSILDGFCVGCDFALKTEQSTGRRKVWKELPGVFELPSWDELRKEAFRNPEMQIDVQ